jgi:hypothetical protein
VQPNPVPLRPLAPRSTSVASSFEGYGDEGDYELDGGDGEDVLAAGPGDDRLTRGAGADHLQGGQGDDVCNALAPSVWHRAAGVQSSGACEAEGEGFELSDDVTAVNGLRAPSPVRP